MLATDTQIQNRRNQSAEPHEAAKLVSQTGSTLPLGDDERRELDRLEDVVQHGLDTFIEVGTALAAIRSARLYRQTHISFERYLEDRFEGRLSRRRAYQLIDAAEVCTKVHSVGSLAPTTERQARELVGLSGDEAAGVLSTVADTGQRLTAKAIKDARRQSAAGQEVVVGYRRRPLPDAYDEAVSQVAKAVGRLSRLHADDRFLRHRDALAGRHWGDLRRHLNDLQALVEHLETVADGAAGGAA